MLLDLTPAEREFTKAMDAYKRLHSITEPTASDMLAVLLRLGYGPQEPEPGNAAAA